jgi:hypothetical protein
MENSHRVRESGAENAKRIVMSSCQLGFCYIENAKRIAALVR